MIRIKTLLKLLFYICIFSSASQVISGLEITESRIFANIIKILPILISYLFVFLFKIPIKKQLLFPCLIIIIVCLSRYILPEISLPFTPLNISYKPNPNFIDTQILNQVIFALYIPIAYLIRPSINEKLIAYYSWIVISITITLSFFISPDIFSAKHNFDYGITSGIAGNPNSFSILCNLIILDIISWNKKPKYFIITIIILLFLGILSGSLLGIISTVLTVMYIFYFIFIKSAFLRIFNRNILYSFLILIPIIVFFIYQLNPILSLTKLSNSVKKISALLEFSGSSSIDLRKDYYQYTFSLISSNPFCLLTGYCRNKYLTGDGYIPTLLASFGIPISFIYLWSYYKILSVFRLINSKNYFSKDKITGIPTIITPYMFSIFLLSTTLITNRLLDYWPFAILTIFITSKSDSDKITQLK